MVLTALVLLAACRGGEVEGGLDSAWYEPPGGDEGSRGEICGNGEDDDRDGRVDCEDGECADIQACYEACTGGVDDDGDGLVDCEDDDCVGMLACTHPRTEFCSRVDRGGGLWAHRESNVHWDSWSQQFTVEDIWGTVIVDNWWSSRACAWQVNRASGVSHTTYGIVVERLGFDIEPDCSDIGSDFLPRLLDPDVRGQVSSSLEVWIPPGEAAWYQGHIVQAEFYVTTGHYRFHSKSFSLDSVGRGVWYVYPPE